MDCIIFYIFLLFQSSGRTVRECAELCNDLPFYCHGFAIDRHGCRFKNGITYPPSRPNRFVHIYYRISYVTCKYRTNRGDCMFYYWSGDSYPKRNKFLISLKLFYLMKCINLSFIQNSLILKFPHMSWNVHSFCSL